MSEYLEKIAKNIRRNENTLHRSVIDIPMKFVLENVREESYKKPCHS
jgi:hypothetical protein